MGLHYIGSKRSFARALTVLAAAVCLTGPAVPHARAQDRLTAAIVGGDCADLGDVAAELRGLTVAEGGALTSFTTVDLAIGDLTSGDYAIAIGDPAAPVACGEITGEGTDVYVAVPARGDSDLGGIAWLHARDNRTQVSLFIGENLGQVPTNPGDDPAGPPEPPAEGTPEPGESTGEMATYTSPMYGYTLTYDASRWAIDEEWSRPLEAGPVDFIRLYPGVRTMLVELTGLAAEPSEDALDITEGFYQWIRRQPNYSDVSLRTDAAGEPIRGGDERHAFIAFDFTFTDDQGDQQELTYHVDHWMMPSTDGILAMIVITHQVAYESGQAAHDSLVAGLTLPE